MTEKRLSLTYRMLRLIGLNYPEKEYGDVSIVRVVKQFFRSMYNVLLINMMDCWLLAPIEPRMLRPWLLRRLGAKVGKGVFVGDHVLVTDIPAFVVSKQTVCRGCSTGTGTLIMPGVTIGEGAIVGAGSLVVKDIPAWTIAVGRPAKVVKVIPIRK